jgi:hypothetical protein
MRTRLFLRVLALFSSLAASNAAAQLRVEVGVTLGRYAPLGSFDATSVSYTALPRAPSGLSGTEFGAQVRVWPTAHFGIELAGFNASSRVGGGSNPNGYEAPLSAHVTIATAAMLVGVMADTSRARIWFEGGAARVQHGGHAYAPFGSPVNYGGAVGIGSAIRLTKGLSAELAFATTIYNMNMVGPNSGLLSDISERGTQVDAQFRTGLSYGLP